MTPTQRSLRLLRAAGYFAAKTEHWDNFAKVRKDLLGFGDILAIKPDETLLVQTTTGANMSHRIAKIRNLPAAALWLQSSNRRIAVHGWRKASARGERKMWQCRVVVLPNRREGECS
jgi:hypothetical protein